MLGVIINVLTVLIGSSLGLLFKKGIPERVREAVMSGLGVCTLCIGLSGAIESENVLIMIASVVIGAIVGTLIGIDRGINKLAEKIEKRFAKKDGVSIAEGLVSSTLLFCVGSMTLTGSLEAGLTGDSTILITKALLDLFSSMMLASSLGIGVMLSAISVLVIQGSLVLAASFLAPVLSESAVNEMTAVGSLLIIMIGLNLLKVTKLKVADYLPAIIIAPCFCALVPVFEYLYTLLF